MERYFHYATKSLIHGHFMIPIPGMRFKLAYIIYNDIPLKIRRFFTYSSKLFGYTFFPTLYNKKVTEYGYNYKPNKELLSKLREVTETDVIYSLMKK